MTIDDVPEVISRFLKAAPKGDDDAVLACFAEDAEVVDEGHTYRTPAELKNWRTTVASKFTYTVEPVDVESDDSGGHVVTCDLKGNFPGGEVRLKFYFVLHDKLISRLLIEA